jgi:L-Lysine epsilon oxidase N-terminal/L-lysine epsilon oxidase C-terminal domain
MGTVYKIHPAIGIARLGNHPSAFFVGPEMPGSPGLEIGADGAESVLTAYKAGGQVKRQGARFRVFEYEEDLDGNEQLVGEVSAEAEVTWKVDLVNRKAALNRIVGPARPRNAGVADRDSLIIRGAKPVVIGGADQPAAVVAGEFLGAEVYLGELRTDARGRLIVLGGRGRSASVPPGAPLSTFANNDRWHDDVADGPVSATVTVPGQAPVTVHEPGWVVVAPPDFAPAVDSIVSLYDIAFQVGIDKGLLTPEPVPSFTRHIAPVISRALDLRWVDDWDQWSALLPLDWEALADPGPGSAVLRARIAGKVKDPNLAAFEMPVFLETYLDQWAAGDFTSAADAPEPVVPEPEQLDRAALGACSGGNFFPGIEGGQNLKDTALYGRPFRLNVTDTTRVFPGCLTEIMAVPWQADFRACDGGVWWPAQRPDMVMTDPAAIPESAEEWENPIGPFPEMVENVLRLGFIVPREVGGERVLVETERDPTFPRQA